MSTTEAVTSSAEKTGKGNPETVSSGATSGDMANSFHHTTVSNASDKPPGEPPEGFMFMPTGPHTAGLQIPYSSFHTGDGSWTPTFDPTLMTAGFGFPAPNMMNPQMQNQFYFPGADMGIWGQDPLLMSSYLLSPVAMEHQQLAGSTVAMDGTGMPNAIDPIAGLGHNFNAMALNGTMQGMMPLGQPAMIPTTPSTPGGVDSSTPNAGTSSNQGQSNAPQPEKPKSWAAVASQPAKPRPPPPKPQPQPDSHSMDSSKKPLSGGNRPGGLGQQSKGPGAGGTGGVGRGGGIRRTAQPQQQQQQQVGTAKLKSTHSDLVGKLTAENKYNPPDLSVSLNHARCFVIKSYAEDDIHRSIKYGIWTSTEHGNRRLDQAFREQKGKGNVYLFFSVNGSGHFCGMAQMMSEVDFNTVTGVWAQDKWKGRMDVKWIYVKDVPNSQLRHIRLENNENKPVTNSRDTQEIPLEKGKQVVKIVHNYHHTTSIFDDFDHYEKKQEEDAKKKAAS